MHALPFPIRVQALADKDFVKCAAVQGELDALQARYAALPTAKSLDLAIAAQTSKLQAAIAAKDYSNCAVLEAQLSQMKAERAEVPNDPEPTPAPPTPAAPAIEPAATVATAGTYRRL